MKNSASKVNKKQGIIALLFMIFSAIYLVPEIIFNTTLVSVLSHSTTKADLEQVELFGRTISGIGLSLMVATFLSMKYAKGRFSMVFFVFIPLSFALCWPLMFFGQKALVEHIAENSTAEQRRDSYLSYGIKNALRSGSLEIKGIPYTGIEGDAYDDTFLILIGSMVYLNEDVLKFFEGKKEEILRLHFSNNSNEKFQEKYALYVQHRTDIRERFNEYQRHSQSYRNELRKVPAHQKKYWMELNEAIRDHWNDLKKYRKAFQARAAGRAPKMISLIDSNIRSWNRCVDNSNWEYRQSCKQRNLKEYKHGLSKLGLHYVERDFWKNSRGVFPHDVAHFQKKIQENMKPDFKRETGYDYSVSTLSRFKSSPVTAQKISDRLKSKYGLILPNGWRATHKKSFDKSVSSLIRKKADAKWEQEMAERSFSIPPNLNWSMFQRDSDIQDQARVIMKDDYVKPMLFDWNDTQFKKHVFMPAMERRIDEAIRKINASLPMFEKGGDLYIDSKNTLKSVLVPPISMTISLFLILLTMFGIFKNILFVMMSATKDGTDEYRLSELQRVTKNLESEGMPVDDEIANETDKIQRIIDKKNHKVKIFSWGLSAFFVISVISIPLFLLDTKAKENNQAVEYMIAELNPLVSGSIEWALNTQPILQEFGAALSEKFTVYELFKSKGDVKNLSQSGL